MARRKQIRRFDRVLFIPDIHCPYHDPVALRIAAKIARDFHPHRIIFLGDVIDAEHISRWPKTKPSAQRDLQDELDTWFKAASSFIQRVGGKPWYQFIPGNHEHRILVWQYGQANISLRCLSIPDLLQLNKLGIDYHSREYIPLADGRFVVKHGDAVRKWAGLSAQAEIQKEGCSGVSGHTHRLAIYRQLQGITRNTWAEAGCLCVNPPAYKSRPQNWQQGLALGEFSRWGGSFWLDVVEINGGVARWGSKTYR